ncbi:hypothetical protein [Pelagibacterium montanilacus]|uniref:hypothetical protein n=1 Tax=Pelagibacterium montanilacus TaxID=2185280 RepID=UPI000F8F4E2F|nr:hypothetical protein [Pelagibacterium montanilacus]
MDGNVDNIDGKNIKDTFNRPARPIVAVDVEKYKAYLDDPALTDAEKESFLSALWSIVVAFVDLGFGVHPLQEVFEPEGGCTHNVLHEAFDSAEEVDSNNIRTRGTDLPSGMEPE